jgi:hypothetical protein
VKCFKAYVLTLPSKLSSLGYQLSSIFNEVLQGTSQ